MLTAIPLPSESIPPFIFIEGNAGAGKTTLAKALHKPSQIFSFAEQSLYIDRPQGERFPPYPDVSADSALSIAPIWLTFEYRREIARRSIANAKLQVIDTSPLTVIGFELAKRQQGLPHADKLLARGYLQDYRSGMLHLPLGWVLLS